MSACIRSSVSLAVYRRRIARGHLLGISIHPGSK
jgi:hypothetical protein